MNTLSGGDALKRLEEEYLDKILGFCYQKVNTREDAEDLASEIALEVLKSVRSGKEIGNMGAFVWSVSNHTFFKWLRRKKYGSTAYLDEVFTSPDNVEEECIFRETENILHREIALLSEKYRKVVVMYYFEGKSCGEIGAILGRSSGTVKWWLHDARTFIKEGFDIMREYGEKSYNPGTLFLSCQGTPGADNEPMSCARRKLPQNILLAAYREPQTLAELCGELGTPAAYIEDEVGNLVKNQLMKELPGGKYQTDFVILPNDDMDIASKIYNACFPGYYDALMDFLGAHRELLSGGKFNTAGFSWDRLLWVYIHVITDIVAMRFRTEVCRAVAYQDMPLRPDGGRWIAQGYNAGLPGGKCERDDGWREYVPWDGPVHKTGKAFAQGYFHYWSGVDSSIFFGVPDDVFALCRDIIEGRLSVQGLDEEQKYLFGVALEKRLFIREGDAFRQNYYFVGGEERLRLYELAGEFYPAASDYLQKAYGIILEEHGAGVPKPLRWQMGNFLSNFLGIFVTGSLYEGMGRHALSEPDENNREWLSLFASGQ